MKTIEKFRPANKLTHEKTRTYTTIPNDILQSVRNPAALGLYVYLASKPENWVICKKELMNHFDKGREYINGCFKHLKSMGLIEMIASRDELGKILVWTTILKDTITQNTENPYCGENSTENTLPTIRVCQSLDKPLSGETTPTKERSNLERKELTTTEEQEKVSSSFSQTETRFLDARNDSDDNRTDEEFIKQCHYHLSLNDKKKYTQEQQIIGLLKLITEKRFTTPAGYKIIPQTPVNNCPFTADELDIIAQYKHALKTGQDLKIFFPTKERLEFANNVWKRKNELGAV